jgi:hypothetical protein
MRNDVKELSRTPHTPLPNEFSDFRSKNKSENEREKRKEIGNKSRAK